MKRLFSLMAAIAVMLFCASEISAQKFGVIGGASFTSIQNIEESSKTGFSVGATAQLRLPLGFSVQPSLVYNQKSAQLAGDMLDVNVGYLELPVSLQWGPDLLLFRPFVDVTPFVGYAVSSKIGLEDYIHTNWDGYMNKLSYGLGLGGGLEVWRFQLICRYNWNFGPLFNDEGKMMIEPVTEMFKDKNFGGVTLSLAFLFGK